LQAGHRKENIAEVDVQEWQCRVSGDDQVGQWKNKKKFDKEA